MNCVVIVVEEYCFIINDNMVVFLFSDFQCQVGKQKNIS
jgi:hypothetical protein